MAWKVRAFSLGMASLLITPLFSFAQNSCTADWTTADGLAEQGRFAEAADAYQVVLGQCPDSQRAAAKVARMLTEAERFTEALDAAQATIDMDPYSRVWAEWGYLCSIRACRQLGCTPHARDQIALMKSRFPDSISTAEAAVIEAELDGAGLTDAQDQLAIEQAAELEHEQATAAIEHGERDLGLQLLDQVIANYAGTRKSLRSMEIKALLLGLMSDRTEEAIDAWLDVIDEVGPTTPDARIVQEAKMRLAALYHRRQDLSQAYDLYAELAEQGTAKSTVSNSALQGAGVYFEMYQRVAEHGGEVPSDAWANVRTHCETVEQLADATPKERAIAKLMYFESYVWERRPEDCLPLAEAFIAEYDPIEFRTEVATAHKFAGSCLSAMGHSHSALDHLHWIVREHEQRGRIWPVVDHIAFTHYLIVNCLVSLEAPPEEIWDAADVLITEYPDTVVARLVRNAIQWGQIEQPAP